MPGQGSDSFVGRGISSYEMNIRLRRALVKRDQVRSRHKTGPNPPDEVMLAEMEVDLLEAQLEEQYQSAEDALEWLKAQRIVKSADVKVAAAKNEFVIGRRDFNEYKNKIKPGAGGYQLFEATFELKVARAEQELKQAKLKQTLILTRQLERKAKELARLREEYFRKKPRAQEDPALDPSAAVTSEPGGK